MAVNSSSLASADAIVYDLDGTLVRLDVDWKVVRDNVTAALEKKGVETNGEDLWGLLDLGRETGNGPLVESIIADHERTGAQTSTRLFLADAIPTTVPVGVCSLNCASAVHIALEAHDLTERVAAVVGRDSLPEQKPHPDPLLAVIEELGADPENTVFVGDSKSDAETAERAGTKFVYVEALRRA
ncbi:MULTISPECIES: HAD family hydrolase [unclassified Haladaptatus]|uniref:HAD family hydrolase n=1 Tax=unclassified Haladaptatus TaxID=2622732 RepID=UPI0023E819D9|nr:MULTISPECIES: HAD-IA family hydrolase [unclassified Haladaptatus]